MKKLLFLIITLTALTSCSSLKMVPKEREVITTFFDFRDYTNEGFFISPYTYPEKFDPCGELLVRVYPAKKIEEGKGVYDSNTRSYIKEKHLVVENISSQNLLDIAVSKAKELGANGIANFKCSIINTSYYDPLLKDFKSVFSHYQISGFCIKILK